MKKLLASMVVMLVSLAASAQITCNVKLGGGIPCLSCLLWSLP